MQKILLTEDFEESTKALLAMIRMATTSTSTKLCSPELIETTTISTIVMIAEALTLTKPWEIMCLQLGLGSKDRAISQWPTQVHQTNMRSIETKAARTLIVAVLNLVTMYREKITSAMELAFVEERIWCENSTKINSKICNTLNNSSNMIFNINSIALDVETRFIMSSQQPLLWISVRQGQGV